MRAVLALSAVHHSTHARVADRPAELLSAAAPRLHTLSRSEVRQYLLGGWERAVFPYLQRVRRVVESTRAAGCPVSRVPLAHVDVSLSQNFQSGLLCLWPAKTKVRSGLRLIWLWL